MAADDAARDVRHPGRHRQPLGMRCGVVDGADLDTLWPILEKANALTPFTSGGKEYTFLVRPLLPDESGCPTF